MTERELIRLVIELCHEQSPPLLVFHIPGSPALTATRGPRSKAETETPPQSR